MVLRKGNWRYIDEWLQDSSQEQRLGLRMLYAVVLNHGERRFKQKEQREPDEVSWEKTASDFRLSFYSTAYGR